MATKKIVIPGELLSDDSSLSGLGTYVSGGKVYASVCGLLTQKGKISVHPLFGPYIPKRNDLIIGYATVITSSNWIFDIGCPYEGLLHVTEYPIRVPSEEMTQHFNIGDTVLLKVTDVNTEMKVELTYKDPICRKLTKGRLFEISPSKVSRVIGRSGAMISMLKAKTGCEIFVGGNGRIWMNGSSDSMSVLMNALKKIEAEAHVSGLTDLVAADIDEQYKLLDSLIESDDDETSQPIESGAKISELESEIKPSRSKKPSAKVKTTSLKKKSGSTLPEKPAEDTGEETTVTALPKSDAQTNLQKNAQKTPKSAPAQKSARRKNESQLDSAQKNCTCYNSIFFTHLPTDGSKSDR